MEYTRNMKMTPVGLIPEDWDVATIKDYGHLLSDGINPQQYREKDFVEYSMPAYDDGHSPTKCKGADMNSNRTQIKGEVLLFNKLNVRQKRVWYIENAPLNALCSMEFLAYSSDKVDLRLLREILLQDSVTKGFESVSRGTSNSQKRIAPSDFLNFSFALPPLAEQHRIADALSCLDDMIGALDEAIAKKRQIKEGLMQQLLTGKTRLSGFSGEWKKEMLGKHATVLRGGSPRPIEAFLTTDPDGINWIKIGDVGVGAKYIVKTEERIIPEGVSRSREVKAGDFLLSNSMSFGRPYILKIDGCIHDGWLVIQDYYDSFDTDYLYYALNASETIEQYKSMAAGSSVLNLNKDIVKRVLVNIPPIDEQKALATVLSSVDEEIVILESKRDKYALVKQGMMQELLTGKTRLI